MSTDIVLHQPNTMAVRAPGVTAQDLMPVLDIAQAVVRHNFMVDVTKKLMVEDVDFGTIPGTNKPTLLKPGAERLCTLYGLSPEFITVEATEDWMGSGHGGEAFFYYRYKCRLTKNGITLGEGEGSCNSWESKYRYRWVREDQLPSDVEKDKLPKRGGVRSIFEPDFALNKAETSGRYGKPAEYWQQFQDAIAAKTAKRLNDHQMGQKKFDGWQITVNELQFRIPNPDIADIVNTVQKMAQKRALVAGVLVATNASEFYTQDMEDIQIIDVTASVVPVSQPSPQRNTADQQAQVAERRIAEEKAKATAPAPVQQQISPAQMAEVELVRAFAAADRFGRLKMFGDLKARLVEICGSEERGHEVYYDILGRFDVGKADQFKTAKAAQDCVVMLLRECMKLAEQPPAPAPSGPIDDNDLPRELFPQEPAYAD